MCSTFNEATMLKVELRRIPKYSSESFFFYFFFFFLNNLFPLHNGSDAEYRLRPISSFWQEFQNVLPKRITANSVIVRCLGAAWRRLIRPRVIFRSLLDIRY